MAHVDKNIAKDAMITSRFYNCLKLMIIAYVRKMKDLRALIDRLNLLAVGALCCEVPAYVQASCQMSMVRLCHK